MKISEEVTYELKVEVYNEGSGNWEVETPDNKVAQVDQDSVWESRP